MKIQVMTHLKIVYLNKVYFVKDEHYTQVYFLCLLFCKRSVILSYMLKILSIP